MVTRLKLLQRKTKITTSELINERNEYTMIIGFQVNLNNFDSNSVNLNGKQILIPLFYRFYPSKSSIQARTIEINEIEISEQYDKILF